MGRGGRLGALGLLWVGCAFDHSGVGSGDDTGAVGDSGSTTEADDGAGESTGAPQGDEGDEGDDDSGPGCEPVTWYLDADGDGFGDPASAIESCTRPDGYADNADDCNDSVAEAHPGSVEVCDSFDNDCDGGFDEGSPRNEQCSGCRFRKWAGAPGVFVAVCEPPLNWFAARDRCAALGGDLAVIGSDDENTFIGGLTTADSWIGFSDVRAESVWEWVDGSAGYANWALGEPNDVGDEDCAVLRDGLIGGGWNDDGCGTAWPFVCEHPE